MKHPTDESIITYLYNEAGAFEINELEAHAAKCLECARKIDNIKKTIGAIDQIDENTMPDFLEEKMVSFFEKLNTNSNGTFDDKNKLKSHDEIMTPAELAEFLKLPIKAIYELLNDIPHLSLAGQIRFRKSSIDKWLDSREKAAVIKKYIPQDFNDPVQLWGIVV